MSNTSDVRIVRHDGTTLVYLPGSRTPLAAGASVVTPDRGTGIVQAVYPESGIAAVAVVPIRGETINVGQSYVRREYTFNRLKDA